MKRSPLPPLDPEIFRGLATKRIGLRCFVVPSLSSTSDTGFDLLSAGFPEGTTLFAEGQTRGRGRMGRVWHSAPRLGLWFSVLLRPRLAREQFGALTGMAAVALRQAIRDATGVEPAIVWPNDLFVGTRKLGGILVEARNLDPDRPAFVLGVGINVHHRAMDFPLELRERATSLEMEIQREVDRGHLATTVLESIDRWYDRLLGGDFRGIERELKSGAALLGHRVALEAGSEIYRGRVSDVTLLGGITLVLDGSGEERTFPGERVSLRLLFA